MRCAYIVVFCLLAFSIHAGSGLRCWSCTFPRDRYCGDPFNRTFASQQDCEYNRPLYSYNHPPTTVCKKQKQMVGDQEHVIRSCEYDRDTACVPMAVHSNVKDVFCQTCNEDSCNSAHSFTPATLTALLSTAFWAMAAKLL